MSEGEETRLGLLDVPATRACDTEDASQRRPYRPVPRDFIQRWPQFGWGGAEAEWHAHARTIARWVDECGRDDMILARKAYLAAERAVRSRARRKRYVMGQTMTPITQKDTPANSILEGVNRKTD